MVQAGVDEPVHLLLVERGHGGPLGLRVAVRVHHEHQQPVAHRHVLDRTDHLARERRGGDLVAEYRDRVRALPAQPAGEQVRRVGEFAGRRPYPFRGRHGHPGPGDVVQHERHRRGRHPGAQGHVLDRHRLAHAWGR